MRLLYRLLGVVVLIGLWLSSLGVAVWLANQPVDWALYALIQWRSLEIQQQAVNKWNGARPQVEGGGSGLLLQVK